MHARGTATQRHGWWWCAAAAVLFGAATPAIKLLVDDIGSVSLAGLLYLGAACAVLPFVRRGHASRATTAQRSRLLAAVVVGGGLAPVLLVLAIDRTPAATVSLLLNFELVATVVIAWLFLHEHLGRRAVAGIGVVLVGGIILTGTAGASVAPGALLVVGACVCWGIDNAITASLDAYTPVQITLSKGVIAGSVNLALGITLTGVPPLRVAVAAVAIGAFGYGVSITMWITGARLIGAARGQAIFALAPFIGALLSWPMKDGGVSWSTGAAFAVSLVGVLLVSSGHHHHGHRHQQFEHAHPIDPSDPHHRPDAIEVLAGDRHRHLPLQHDHEHLPDIHHRHDH